MKDFKKSFRGNRSEGGSRGGARSGGLRGGNRDRRDGGFSRGGNNFSPDFNAPQMHKTSCTSCGNMAEVPFKPTGDKPVLCSNCFGSQRDGGRGGDRRDGGNKGCFFNRPSAPDQSKDVRALQDQMKALHVKMDAVMKSLGLVSDRGDAQKSSTLHVSGVTSQDVARVKVPKIEKPKPEELTNAVAKALEKKTTQKVASKKVTKKVASKKVAKKSTAKPVKKAVKKKK